MEEVKSTEYRETRQFCYCFTLKCGIICLGILMICDVVLKLFEVYQISQNEYFDAIYWQVYLVLIIPLLIGACLFFYYFCAEDSPSSRAPLPLALLLATISNFLIATWIIVYICYMYKRDKVYINRMESNEDDDSGTTTKTTYTK